jgi:hypothetical protein
MVGHCWATALFPSGRAFGFQRFPRPDGTVGFSEGWASEGDGRVEATVVDAPWLEELPSAGQHFEIELEVEGTSSRLEAELRSAMLMTVAGSGDLAWMRQGLHDGDGLVLVQSMARYTWDGEVTYGFLERSALRRTLRGAATGAAS